MTLRLEIDVLPAPRGQYEALLAASDLFLTIEYSHRERFRTPLCILTPKDVTRRLAVGLCGKHNDAVSMAKHR